MRNLLCGLALASVASASPALARDHQFYFGIDAGAWIIPGIHSTGPDFAGTGLPPVVFLSQAAVPEATTSTRERVSGDFKTGTDLDLTFGYDFGRIRAEAEFARKHSKFDSVTIHNSFFGSFLDGTHDTRGSIDALSAMVNVLYDQPIGHNADIFVGPGIGYGRLKLTPRVDLFDDGTFGDELHRTKRSGVMAQLVAGVRFALSDHIDAGLKYRFIRSEKLSYDAGVLGDLKGHLETHSALLSLTYNFGGRPAPVPVVAPEAPVPPVAPATQTCSDGSVILATAACPVPPAPAPAPAATGERG